FTHSPDLVHLVADKNNSAPTACDVTHLAKALLLEGSIANSKNFIDEENFWLQVGSDGKRQTHLHSGAVVLKRGVDEFLDLRKCHHLVKLAIHFTLAHAQDCTAQKNILPAGELRMEASTDFEEGSNAATDFRPATGWARNPRKDFE